MAEANEDGAQFGIVVDGAVEDEGQPARRVHHRLSGALRQVDDRQAPMAEGDASVGPATCRIRPAPRQAVAHAQDGGLIGLISVPAEFTGNATHPSRREDFEEPAWYPIWTSGRSVRDASHRA